MLRALFLVSALLIASCVSQPPCVVIERVGELGLSASATPVGGTAPGAWDVDLDLKNVSTAPIRIAMTPYGKPPIMFGIEELTDGEWQPVDVEGMASEAITAEFLTVRPGESVRRTLRLSASEVSTLAGLPLRALYLLATSDDVWSGVVFSREFQIPSATGMGSRSTR